MDDDQQFCLRWNNHQSTLISVFDTLLEKGVHVDCTLAAEGRTLRAHKVVLSACSPYFEAVLGQHFDKHPIIVLKDVKFAELRAMMDYMYRGEVNISQDQLGALLKAAESLQIKGLSDSKPSSSQRPPPEPPRESPKRESLPQLPLPAPALAQPSLNEGPPSPKRKRGRKRRVSPEPPPTIAPAEAPQVPQPPPPPPVDEPPEESEADVATPLVVHHENSHEDAMRNELKPEALDQDTMDDEDVEDLTVDEDAISDGEQRGACSSAPSADCQAQGFPWAFDRSQEENMMGPDGQRDMQGASATKVKKTKQNPSISLFVKKEVSDNGSAALAAEMAPILFQLRKISAKDPSAAIFSAGAATSDTQNNNATAKIEIGTDSPLIKMPKCEAPDSDDNCDDEGDLLDDILLPDEAEVFGYRDDDDEGEDPPRGRRGGGAPGDPPPQFECRHCGKRYRWKSTLRRHESVECGGKPPAHACPYCPYRAKQRGNLGVHIRKHHNAQWGAFADSKLRKAKRESGGKNVTC